MRLKIFLLICTLSFFFLSGCNNNTVKEYYESGELKAEYKTKNGVRHGKCCYYYQNGNKEKTVCYINGKENGLYQEFYPNGKLKMEAYYKKGKQDGLLKVYFENGQLKIVNEFSSGKNHYFFPSGKTEMEAIVKNDSTVYYRKYNKKGEITEEFRSIHVIFDKDSVVLGDSILIRIEVSGPISNGDRLRIIANAYKYDSTITNEEYKNLSGTSNKNSVEYYYVPQESGEFVLEGSAYIFCDSGTTFRHPFSKLFNVNEKPES